MDDHQSEARPEGTPSPPLAPVLFVLAGLASLVAAVLNDGASGFVLVTQLVGAVAFFALGWLWSRRNK